MTGSLVHYTNNQENRLKLFKTQEEILQTWTTVSHTVFHSPGWHKYLVT